MKKRTGRKHPFGLLAIILLQTVLIVILVADFGSRLTGFASVLFQNTGGISPSLLLFEVAIILYVAVTTLGLWRFRRWAWMLLMIQLGLSMAFGLWNYFNAASSGVAIMRYIIMLRDVVLVFYLNQREIQGLFEREEGKRLVREAVS